MLDRNAILARIPHQGASCLLDNCLSWSETTLHATSLAHQDPHNPLRRHGRLSPIVGAEIAMQAAALHGTLTGNAGGPPGYLAALRDVAIQCDRLDKAGFGALQIHVTKEHGMAGGLAYAFSVTAENGEVLVKGRGTVVLRYTGKQT